MKKTIAFKRGWRSAMKMIFSPIVPFVLVFIHLYAIALELRNPFEKIEFN